MLYQLNSNQEEAVRHVEGPLLVLAGAGSGKTRVVTARIAHLLEIGIAPSDIVAVTFTNKAAAEMRHRVEALKNAHVLTSTFHSLGVKILRESITALGFEPHFIIYDEEDSEKILKSAVESLGFSYAKDLAKQWRHAISLAKNNLTTPKNSLEFQIYQAYNQKLKECNAVDFDDLLYLPVTLFQEHPHVLQEYQNRWLFLLIDEYQDTNHAQYTLAKCLSSKHKNIFAVGDPDQSIYSWRGAKYENILNFASDFPGAKIITLDQNYRSTNHILQAANALIKHNRTRYEKKLWSALGDGAKVALITAYNEKKEAEFIANKILKYHLKNQIPYDKIAIFYRTNAQSRSFEDVFLTNHIPFAIIGGISFYDRKEVKDILAFLRVVISDTDLISFLRTINLPKRGLGDSTIDKLIQAAAEYHTPLFTFCEEILHSNTFKLSPKQRSGLLSYVEMIRFLRAQKNQISLKDLVQETIQMSCYLSYLDQDPETVDDRKENLNALMAKAEEWSKDHPNLSLVEFLEELTLRSEMSKDPNLSTVKLMTLHNSKGLEFDYVFLAGLEEEILPHINSKDKPSAIEEERRLCYVGMTRAKKELTLSYSRFRFLWGFPKTMFPSRFLDEIPDEHLQYAEKSTTY